VKPRRLFVRAVPEPTGQLTISVAGLDRVDGREGLAAEVRAFALACGLSDSEADKEEP